MAVVKANRHLFHAFLALLLVLSQQLGMMHAVSHWSDFRSGSEQQAADANEPGLSAGLALDHNCSQCAAFASLATAIGTPHYSFLALDASAPQAGAPLAAPHGARAGRAYDSRAPPLA